MNYLKITLGIFLALAASRFIPHPPNFTSLIALSFYIPAILGIWYLPALIISFIITDLFIGFHGVILFTWGSALVVGLISIYFKKNFKNRVFGALFGACIFYIVTNFGVWSLGSYGYTIQGLAMSYTLAIPFFVNTIISTLIFSLIIELVVKVIIKNFYQKNSLTI